MKKIFSIIGFATIVTLSFILTEKTATVAKDIDEIMNTIKEEYKKYEQEPADAIINNNTIIPGNNGKKININESYEEMKKIGKYNKDYYKYREIIPTITINNIYDKYIISGNKKNNMVSLIFIVKEKDDIENILKILKKNQVKATFFIDSRWLKKNNELTNNLIKEGNTIGNLSINNDYKNPEFIWANNIINKIGKQKENYCYAEKENQKNLLECANVKVHTIMPDIIIKNNLIQETKEKITSGSLIAININSNTEKQLELTIKYIKSKGYLLGNLQSNISEKNTN